MRSGINMTQASFSLIKKLSPAAFAKTEQERSLAQFARARSITQIDVAIAFVILTDYVLTSLDAVTRWLYVGFLDLLLTALLVLFLLTMRTFRPLLSRLMVVGLIAGICELFTDASG